MARFLRPVEQADYVLDFDSRWARAEPGECFELLEAMIPYDWPGLARIMISKYLTKFDGSLPFWQRMMAELPVHDALYVLRRHPLPCGYRFRDAEAERVVLQEPEKYRIPRTVVIEGIDYYAMEGISSRLWTAALRDWALTECHLMGMSADILRVLVEEGAESDRPIRGLTPVQAMVFVAHGQRVEGIPSPPPPLERLARRCIRRNAIETSELPEALRRWCV